VVVEPPQHVSVPQFLDRASSRTLDGQIVVRHFQAKRDIGMAWHDIFKSVRGVVDFQLDEFVATDADVHALALALVDDEISGNIQDVRLGRHAIGSDGAKAFAEAVLSSSAIVSVSGLPVADIKANTLTSLVCPPLDDCLAVVLSTLLTRNTSLTSLSVHDSTIGPSGEAVLFEALQVLSYLFFLCVCVCVCVCAFATSFFFE
jgi:hypothetical protein